MGTEDTLNIPRDKYFRTPQQAWEMDSKFILVRPSELRCLEGAVNNGDKSGALELLKFMMSRGER